MRKSCLQPASGTDKLSQIPPPVTRSYSHLLLPASPCKQDDEQEQPDNAAAASQVLADQQAQAEQQDDYLLQVEDSLGAQLRVYMSNP